MKKVIIVIVIAFVFQSCATLNSGVYSVTFIEPNKTFALGEGKHLSYSAKIKNIGIEDVEIFKQELQSKIMSIGVLKVGQIDKYEIPEDTAVFFKNYSKSKSAELSIELFGATNLSMGYK